MSEYNKVVIWFDQTIELDGYYFISYSDQKQELTNKQREAQYANYYNIKSWPETKLKWIELEKLGPGKNPNWIRITGRVLIEWGEKGFVPQFDRFFAKSRKLLMIEVAGMAWFMENSKNLKRS